MRSQLVFKARIHVPNPFQLCQLTSKASRGLHGGAFISTSQAINEALELLSQESPAESILDARLNDLAA